MLLCFDVVEDYAAYGPWNVALWVWFMFAPVIRYYFYVLVLDGRLYMLISQLFKKYCIRGTNVISTVPVREMLPIHILTDQKERGVK